MVETNSTVAGLGRSEAKLLAALNERPQHFQLVSRTALRRLVRLGLAVIGPDLYARPVQP